MSARASDPDATDRPLGSRSTGGRSPADRPLGSPSTGDRSTADRATADRATADRSTADRSTADRLLDAAVTRVAAGGVQSVSIAGVREDVGVSVGAVYHHFVDRQALLDGAWLRSLASHQQALLDAIEGAGDARQGIVDVVAAYLEWHGTHRDEAVVLREPGPPRSRPDAWKQRTALNRPFFAALQGWWAAQAEAGALRELSPVLIHALWLGPARDLCDLWLQGVPSGEPATHAAVLGDAAWRAVAA